MVINDCPRSRATGPGLKRVGGGTNLAMSSLSLPPGGLYSHDDVEIIWKRIMRMIVIMITINNLAMSSLSLPPGDFADEHDDHDD